MSHPPYLSGKSIEVCNSLVNRFKYSRNIICTILMTESMKNKSNIGIDGVNRILGIETSEDVSQG